MDAAKLDPNMAIRDPGLGLTWYDAKHLTLEGKGWTDTPSVYSRLPRKAEGVVRDPVWQLSRCPAGMAIRFITDTTDLAVKWDGCSAMDHMPALGVSGLDVYVKHEDAWKWLSVGRPTREQNEVQLFSGLAAEEREYMLYLPLYNPLKQIQLGIPESAGLAPAPVRPQKPLCFYGTSITQGGCASRPGMCYSAIIGRRFDIPVINLGFSGNGRTEPEIADLLCELDPSVYILDPLPNMTPDEVKERIGPAVRKIRETHPETPVILVDNIRYCDAFLKSDRMERYREGNNTLRIVYDQLVSDGIGGVHHLPDTGLIGTDGESTVDGAHFSDLGYMRFADAVESFIINNHMLDR